MTEALREWVDQKFSELARDSTLRRDLLKFNGFSKLVNSAIAKGLEAGADLCEARGENHAAQELRLVDGLERDFIVSKRILCIELERALRAKALRLRGGGGVGRE